MTVIVGIYGLGYVGLPLAIRFAEVGTKVIGFDVDEKKVRSIANGESYIEHISAESIKEAGDSGFTATADFARTSEVDALILCVPTPLTNHRDPDMSYITSTLDAILPHLRKGQLLSLESTTYPGTTDEMIRHKVEERGFTVGEDLYLVYSPEREDPGNQHFSIRTIPKVVGGCTPKCLEKGIDLYSKIIDTVVPVSSTQTAEIVKLMENIYRAVNIGLVNEMKIVTQKLDVDIFEVIRAAATKPFGYTAFYPGPGLGGHCIPIDPFYLSWKVRSLGVNTRFIDLAGEVNREMTQYVVDNVAAALNKKKKAVNGSRILALGVAYKKNVDDMRESPSVEIMEMLDDMGAEVAFSDPHIASFPKSSSTHFDLKSTELTADALQQFDCVVLLTDHDDFDYDLIREQSDILVDTRGKYSESFPSLVRA